MLVPFGAGCGRKLSYCGLAVCKLLHIIPGTSLLLARFPILPSPYPAESASRALLQLFLAALPLTSLFLDFTSTVVFVARSATV